MNRKVMFIFLVPITLTLTACVSNLEATKMPGADLSKLHNFYVQKLSADERGIEQLIANQLNRMGFIAVGGANETPSFQVDAIVTYQDKWMWDITMYMIQLSMQVRDPASHMVLVTGEVMRSSLVRKDPEGMVEEILSEMFKGNRP